MCTSTNFVRFLKLPYSDKYISKYLLNFYGGQGHIDLDYLNNVDYSLCKCESCKGIFQEFIPNDFLMEKLYEEWISPEKALTAHKEKETNRNFLVNYITEIKTINEAFFHRMANVQVLDFGMGWGTWAITAQRIGWEVCGAELSKSRIEYATKRGVNTINPVTEQTGKYNFINTEQVFEHLPEPLSTLKTLKQWLKKEGIIKISVPSAKNIEDRLKEMNWDAPKHSRSSLNPVAPLEHINLFQRESIIKMGELVGLRKIKLPIGVQYKNTYWEGNFKGKIKKALRPLRINYINDINYIFLRKF